MRRQGSVYAFFHAKKVETPVRTLEALRITTLRKLLYNI